MLQAIFHIKLSGANWPVAHDEHEWLFSFPGPSSFLSFFPSLLIPFFGFSPVFGPFPLFSLSQNSLIFSGGRQNFGRAKFAIAAAVVIRSCANFPRASHHPTPSHSLAHRHPIISFPSVPSSLPPSCCRPFYLFGRGDKQILLKMKKGKELSIHFPFRSRKKILLFFFCFVIPFQTMSSSPSPPNSDKINGNNGKEQNEKGENGLVAENGEQWQEEEQLDQFAREFLERHNELRKLVGKLHRRVF